MNNRTCSLEECERPRRRRYWCEMHYSRLHRTGRVDKEPKKQAVGSGRTSCWAEPRECEDETCRLLFIAHGRRNRRFCSMSCAKRDMNRNLTDEQRANRDRQWSRHRFPQGERECEICNSTYKPLSSRQRWCSTCIPTHEARGRYQRTGFTDPQWQQALARFNGLCWLCKKEPATDADHCHKRHKPRGALCSRCNLRLGYYEDHEWTELARAYLAIALN